MIPYSTQTINNRDINSVVKTMKSSFLTQGPKIRTFEKLISKKVNSKYTSVVNSATSALHISCMALNFKKAIYYGLLLILFLHRLIAHYI